MTASLWYAIGVAAEEAASVGTVLQKVKYTSAGSRLYLRKNRRLILRRRHQLLGPFCRLPAASPGGG